MYSSHQISLKEFISSIPICQHGAALETILNASQNSKNGTVVIIDSQGLPLGIITAHRLLSLLVKYQHNRRITTSVGSQKHFDGRAALMATTDLTSLIEPVRIVSDRQTISEFLGNLSNDFACRESEYAFVDEKGKFLGMLNTQKLFEFLLEENKQPQPQASKSLPSLFSLIENINLPLMLQGSRGEILYQNPDWQRHLHRTQRATDYSSQIAQWWLWQQASQQDKHQLRENPLECDDSTVLFANTIAEEGSTKEFLELERFAHSSVFAATDLQISCFNSWYYVKLPLNFAETPTNASQKRECWLVLAIKAENEQNSNISEEVDWSCLKDRFLAYISHELKSPLTGIVGLSNLLKAQKLGVLNRRQAHYTELIYRSGKRLSETVNDLLKLTKLTTDKQNLSIEPLDLETLCRQTYQQTINELKATEEDSDEIVFTPHLELSIEPDSQTVFADKSSLTQILSCSLERAIKSKPKQIGITVNSWTSWIAVVVWFQTSVSALPQQLSNYQELENSDLKIDSNSDLSLLVARQLAKSQGGDLSYISKANGRSEFTFLLPNTVNEDRQEPSSSGERLLVLIVETLPARLATIASKIKDLGYYSVIARTGIEALQQARRLKPSYILLNPASSLLAAKDLLTLLKSDPNTQNIPIFILTTAKNKLKDSQTFRQAQGVICEPFDRDTLAQILPVKDDVPAVSQNITVLCVYPEPEAIEESLIAENLVFNLKDWAEKDWTSEVENNGEFKHDNRYRIIEADGLEQAHMLARIWQLDVVVLDSVALKKPLAYLRALQKLPSLASLPLITLDPKTSAVANQIGGLTVYPCLLPAKSRSIDDLMQVIQIATKNSRSRTA